MGHDITKDVLSSDAARGSTMAERHGDPGPSISESTAAYARKCHVMSRITLPVRLSNNKANK